MLCPGFVVGSDLIFLSMQNLECMSLAKMKEFLMPFQGVLGLPEVVAVCSRPHADQQGRWRISPIHQEHVGAELSKNECLKAWLAVCLHTFLGISWAYLFVENKGIGHCGGSHFLATLTTSKDAIKDGTLKEKVGALRRCQMSLNVFKLCRWI